MNFLERNQIIFNKNKMNLNAFTAQLQLFQLIRHYQELVQLMNSEISKIKLSYIGKAQRILILIN